MTTLIAPETDAPAAPQLDLDALAEELDAIRKDVESRLGEQDARYIKRVIKTQRLLELAGRVLLTQAGRKKPLIAGTAVLTLAKVIENMEIGHNVMHGQYDWMGDPAINSRVWEWDAASTRKSWQYSHNYQHHTYTNIVGKDRDLGYSAMRVDPEQPWKPVYLLQPIYGVLMAFTFEWGIALYDMELDAVRDGRKSKEQAKDELALFAKKAAKQLAKDYVLFPALAGRHAKRAALATAVANVARSTWVHTVVFMGHIPEGAETFTEQRLDGETRGGWYHRQLIGSCNLEGTPLFHILTGNLSHQIEHHLFPDIPASRYRELSPRVRAVCEKHGLPYNSGRLGKQYLSVARKILRLSLP